ncbi:MAG: transcriptional regulator [Rhizobiales bacterium PAR1]|nr:MAG: transcriptional regulator [Rhizobiales bacterium PAR1]
MSKTNAQSWSEELETELRSDIEASPELEELMRNAREASDLLKALAHENRLLLLCILHERERSVGELEAILSLRQATVSQQLARLRFDGLVKTRRDGKAIYYSIANEHAREIVRLMYDMFCGSRRAGTATNKP